MKKRQGYSAPDTSLTSRRARSMVRVPGEPLEEATEPTEPSAPSEARPQPDDAQAASGGQAEPLADLTPDGWVMRTALEPTAASPVRAGEEQQAAPIDPETMTDEERAAYIASEVARRTREGVDQGVAEALLAADPTAIAVMTPKGWVTRPEWGPAEPAAAEPDPPDAEAIAHDAAMLEADATIATLAEAKALAHELLEQARQAVREAEEAARVVPLTADTPTTQRAVTALAEAQAAARMAELRAGKAAEEHAAATSRKSKAEAAEQIRRRQVALRKHTDTRIAIGERIERLADELGTALVELQLNRIAIIAQLGMGQLRDVAYMLPFWAPDVVKTLATNYVAAATGGVVGQPTSFIQPPRNVIVRDIRQCAEVLNRLIADPESVPRVYRIPGEDAGEVAA